MANLTVYPSQSLFANRYVTNHWLLSGKIIIADVIVTEDQISKIQKFFDNNPDTRFTLIETNKGDVIVNKDQQFIIKPSGDIFFSQRICLRNN